MEIKGPSFISPQQPDLHLETEQKKTSSDQPTTTTKPADLIEVDKTGNDLANAIQAAQQDEGYTGEAHLDSEQQNLVSKFHPENEHPEDFSYFLKDARSTSEDKTNSGKDNATASPNADKFQNLTFDEKANIIGGTSNEQTPDAVKDADRFLTEGARDAVNDEVADRHSDLNTIAGSESDRLRSLLDPTADGPQEQSSVGKDKPAYELDKNQLNSDGSITHVRDGVVTLKDSTIVYHDETNDTWGTTHSIKTQYYEDMKVESDSTIEHVKNYSSGKEEAVITTTTTTTTKSDGTSTTEKEETVYNLKDGTTTTTTTNTPGGSAKSYNYENYHGSIPEAVQRLTDFFKQQAAGLRPQTGPGNVDPSEQGDANASGSPDGMVLRNANLRFAGVQTGDNLLGPNGPQPDGGSGGTVGNPNETIGPASQHGGAVDDSEGVGYTGHTYTDDPGDVHFGSEQPVIGMSDSKNANEGNKTFTLDPDALHNLIENIWKGDPAQLSQFFANLKKSE